MKKEKTIMFAIIIIMKISLGGLFATCQQNSSQIWYFVETASKLVM